MKESVSSLRRGSRFDRPVVMRDFTDTRHGSIKPLLRIPVLGIAYRQQSCYSQGHWGRHLEVAPRPRRLLLSKFVFAALLVALAIPTVATAKPTGVPGQIAALQRQVKAQQRQITTLQNSLAELGSALNGVSSTANADHTALGTLAAVDECHYAQQGTLDYDFVDLFAALTGSAPQFTGQTVPDNGTCAQVGLTPPGPAGAARLPANPTRTQMSLRAIAILLGVAG